MKVLVTGGLGYIGSEVVVSLLENKHEVVIIDDLSNSRLEVLDGIEKITGIRPKFYQFDVKELDKLEKVFVEDKPESIIHLAGFKAVAESVEKPTDYYFNNLISALNLFKCMDKFGCKNFVFSSSATVYGVPERVPVVETDPIQDGTCPYGETKIMIERMIQDIAKRHPEYNIVVLRYFNPIGAHPSGLLGEYPSGRPNNLVPCISKAVFKEINDFKVTGTDYPTPDGTGIRDYLHVVDLAYGHVLALNKINEDCGYVIYNLGTGKGNSVYDIIHTYEKANNIKIDYQIAPRRAGDIAINFANCDKAKKELGFECKYTLLDACKHEYEFHKRVVNK